LIATAALALVNPYLSLLMAYDYFLLLGYAKVLNQTTFVLALDQNKREIYINRLNFLGYHTKFEEHKKYRLRSVKYVGEYVNEYVTIDNKGLLPSISRMMNFSKLPEKK
jgi:hypothetical protein